MCLASGGHSLSTEQISFASFFFFYNRTDPYFSSLLLQDWSNSTTNYTKVGNVFFFFKKKTTKNHMQYFNDPHHFMGYTCSRLSKKQTKNIRKRLVNSRDTPINWPVCVVTLRKIGQVKIYVHKSRSNERTNGKKAKHFSLCISSR